MAATKGKDKHLLFEEEGDDDPAESKDPALQQKINQYMEERNSRKALIKARPRTGVKPKLGQHHDDDDEDEDEEDDHVHGRPGKADDDDEPDYDVAGRMTLKSTSEAFMDVMAEAREQFKKEKEEAKAHAKAALAAKAPAKGALKKS